MRGGKTKCLKKKFIGASVKKCWVRSQIFRYGLPEGFFEYRAKRRLQALFLCYCLFLLLVKWFIVLHFVAKNTIRHFPGGKYKLTEVVFKWFPFPISRVHNNIRLKLLTYLFVTCVLTALHFASRSIADADSRSIWVLSYYACWMYVYCIYVLGLYRICGLFWYPVSG